jgi:ligand-binding sensor domain-containing protein
MRFKIISLFLLFLHFFFLTLSFAGISDWTTYTNMNQLTQILFKDGKIWSATTGGAFVFDPSSGFVEKITNALGLGGNSLYALCFDSSGTIWLGADNGTLTKLQTSSGSFRIFNFVSAEGQKLKLQYILLDQDKLWIASDIGISLFLIERNGGEIKESYHQLGSLPENVGVNQILFRGDTVWAASDRGVAFALKNDINLKDPTHWVSFASGGAAGLPNDTIFSLGFYQDKVFAGTGKGLFRFSPDSNLWFYSGPDTIRINVLKQMDSLLFAGTGEGVYFLKDSIWTRLDTLGLFSLNINSLDFDEQKGIWAGTSLGLSYLKKLDSTWQSQTVEGPPGNVFSSIKIDNAGNLLCANSWEGAAFFNGSFWTSFSSQPEIIRKRVDMVEIDSNQNQWFATWGGGAVKRNSSGSFTLYYKNPFSPISADPNYVVVNKVAVDEMGNRWFTNWEAFDGKTLLALPANSDSNWTVFYQSQGFVSNLITAFFPYQNHLWIGFKSGGLVDFAHQGTISNFSDDQFSYYGENDRLIGDVVASLSIDKEGILWVGTNAGLNRYDPDYQRFFPVNIGSLGPQVNVIVVDACNNKWIGTINGLGLLNEKGELKTIYQTSNSKICSDLIFSLAFDENSGDVWIGTDNGLSRFESGLCAPTENLKEIVPYPNPYIISEGNEILRFLPTPPYGSQIRIFSLAGELIKELKNQTQWDGKNQSGLLVSSGIYLFHIQAPDGKSAVGKLALIRK